MSRPLNSESVFRAIADPTRRRMLDLLRERERPVSELIGIVRLKPPALSHHLGVLLSADLVRQRRRGRERLYSLNSRPLGPVHAWIARYPSRPAAT